MTRLSRLLRPKSIAVFGSVWAENVVAQCQKMGFTGEVWPVHPTRAEIGGILAHKSLQDLPSPPDAAFIGINRTATVNIVSDLSKMGAGGAVCFASGWAEAGEPWAQEYLVVEAGKMPILGPNCYGLINYLDGALLWPDQHGGRRVERGVAIISQSSNIAINLTMQRRGLPIAYVACLGNAAMVGLTELAEALLSDDRVTALGAYVEGIDDAFRFAALAERARQMGKGIAVIKSGKTPAARDAAASHTAAFAGGGAASSAYLRQSGVAEVNSPTELIEILKIFHVHGASLGKRICSVSCSGGEAGLVADLAAPLGLSLPPPAQAQSQRLSEILGPLVTIANPLDYHTFIWGDGPRTTDVFTTMLSGYDAGIFIIDPPRPDRCDPSSFQPALDAISAAAKATGKPAFPVASLPENMDEALAEEFMAKGIVPLMGLETALAAIKASQTLRGEPGWRPVAPHASGETQTLSEADAKALLTKRSLVAPKFVQAETLAELSEKAKSLKPPLALKGLGLTHKTEAGAVRLNLTSLHDQPPMSGATGYLAEEMVTDVIAELLVGLQRDPIYGVTLTICAGGVMTELLNDTATLILPASDEAILDALQELRIWPLLNGFRGGQGADIAELTKTISRLQEIMLADPEIEEIEINPLMIRAHDAVAADALIRIAAHA
jgi:acetate---CoA ligase (ADP-forming)